MSGSSVKIDGVAYEVDSSISRLFAANNAAVLNQADITVALQDNKIVKVADLTLHSQGKLNGLTADGKRLTIEQLTVNAENVVVENVTITKDVVLTDNVAVFDVDNVSMQNLSTSETQRATRVQAVAMRAVQEVEKPATRLKITFKNSTVVYMEIKKIDTALSVFGATQIGILAVESNSSIVTDPGVVIPKLQISKGVTHIELNASIENVEIETNDDIEITGKGHFDAVTIKTDKSVALKTEGTITTIVSDSKNVELGINVMVDKTVNSKNEETPASEMITNYEEVKDNIKDKPVDGGTEPDNPGENTGNNPDEHEQNFIIAKPIPVEGKFGYAKLSVLNAINHEVRYRFVQTVSLAKKGESVPADTIVYNEGDEFISWHGLKLEIYTVDSNGKVVDSTSYDLFRQGGQEFSKLEIVNGKVRFQMTLEPTGTEFEDFYLAQNDQFFMPELAKNYFFKVDPATGIPTVEFDIPSGFTYVEGEYVSFNYSVRSKSSGVSSFEYLGEYADHFKTSRYAIKQVADKFATRSSWNLTYFFETLLRMNAYEPEPIYNENGELQYTNHHSIALPMLLNQYVKAVKNTASFDTPEQVKQLVIAVNNDPKNKQLVSQYEAVSAQVTSLFVEDHYDYSIEEQLAATTTKQSVEAAKVALSELKKSVSGNLITQLDSLISQAESILQQLELIKTSNALAKAYLASPSREKGYEVENLIRRFSSTNYHSLVFEKYVAALANTEITTGAQLKALITKVNDENTVLVQTQQQLESVLAEIYVENLYRYAQIERLKDPSTAAAKLVQFDALLEKVSKEQFGYNTYSNTNREVNTILQRLETLSNSHELAKEYINQNNYEARNALTNLLYGLQSGQESHYKQELQAYYIAELAKKEYTTLPALKQMLVTVNNAFQAELALANKITALFKENQYQYRSFEQLRDPIAAAEALGTLEKEVQQAALTEDLRKSLLNRVYEVKNLLMQHKLLNNLQQYVDIYLNFSNEQRYTEDYYEISNGLRNLFQSVSINNDYKYELFELYVAEAGKKSQWTLTELSEMISKVSADDQQVFSQIESVRNAIDNLYAADYQSLAQGVTLETFIEIEDQLKQLPESVQGQLEQSFKSKMRYLLAQGEFSESFSSLDVSSNDGNTRLTFTFNEAIEGQDIDLTFKGSEVAAVANTATAEVTSDGRVIVKLPGLESVPVATVTIQGLKDSAGKAVVMKDIPVADLWR